MTCFLYSAVPLLQYFWDLVIHGWIQRQGRGPKTPEKSQNYRVSYQNWSGFPENHKATKLAFNVGPSATRQRNAISMMFRWRANDGPLLVVFGSYLSSLTKKTNVKVGPL